VVASKAADPFGELRRVARRSGQRGCFTSAQAAEAGLQPWPLRRLVKNGTVVLVAPRVYRFTVGAALTWKDHLAAELLSTGGIACGLSAPALYGLVDPPARPQVLVPRGSRHAVPGRHTTRDLTRVESVTVGGLRALSPVRMVLDSVHRLPADRAVALVESAIVRGLVKPFALERRARELKHPRRPGCAITLRILGELHPELARSRNEWEALVARRAREYGVEPPSLEYDLDIDGHHYIADAAWPALKIALEFDGRDPHMRRAVHDNDSGRRNDFVDALWLRFSVTSAALEHGADRTFAQVARAIARRQAAGTASMSNTT
jgi:hypothetical protein